MVPAGGNFHPPLIGLLFGIFVKISSIFLAPVLLQQCALIATFFLLYKLAAGKLPMDYKTSAGFLVLYFLSPFTHESVLFLDIDNTLLVVFGALFILVQSIPARPIPKSILLGAVFAFGFWSKLTTPAIVLATWIVLEIIRKPGLSTVVNSLFTIGAAALLFFATYLPFCFLQQLDWKYCFISNVSRFTGQTHESFTLSVLIGKTLRAWFYDLHWFSFLFVPLVLVKSALDIRNAVVKRAGFISLYPMLFFMAIYLAYSSVFTTPYYMPRYKYCLLPFFVWWMMEPFCAFWNSLRRRDLIWLGAAGLALSFVLPDFPTSAAHYKFWYHSFSLIKIPVFYYPESLTKALLSVSAWSKGNILLFPLRCILFIVYYLTVPGILLLLLHVAVVFGVYKFRFHDSLNAVFAVCIPLWISIFIMDSSREFQLFYDAGATGFPEAVRFLKERVAPNETFLGYKDLAAYAERPFEALYYYRGGTRVIDTTWIDSVNKAHNCRYLAYVNDNIYDDPALKAYASRNFLREFRFGNKNFLQYSVWER
jgi:hypothetical protein